MKNDTHFTHTTDDPDSTRSATRSIITRSIVRTSAGLAFVVVLAVMLAGALMLAPTTTLPAQAETQEIATIDGYKIRYSLTVTPLNIVIEAPGKAWFTAPDANVVGSLVVSTTVDLSTTLELDDVPYSVSFISPTVENSEPYDLTYADGEIWFTQRSANKIGRINTTTKQLTEYDIPTADSGPTGIDVAADGIVWFVEANAQQLGRFDPVTEQFTEIPFEAGLFDTADPQPRDLAVSGSNRIWFTTTEADALVLYQYSTDTWLLVEAEDGDTPSHVVIDRLGQPWVTTTDRNALGLFLFGTLDIWNWFEIPAPNSGPIGIAYTEHPNDNNIWNLWFAASRRNSVARITVNRVTGRMIGFQECALSPNSNPWGIEVDANQHVWAAEMGAQQITELVPPYCFQINFPKMHR